MSHTDKDKPYWVKVHEALEEGRAHIVHNHTRLGENGTQRSFTGRKTYRFMRSDKSAIDDFISNVVKSLDPESQRVTYSEISILDPYKENLSECKDSDVMVVFEVVSFDTHHFEYSCNDNSDTLPGPGLNPHHPDHVSQCRIEYPEQYRRKCHCDLCRSDPDRQSQKVSRRRASLSNAAKAYNSGDLDALDDVSEDYSLSIY